MANEISINDVKQVLKQLLSSEISREDASLWALNRREEVDNNALIYIPEKHEEILWDAILFIEGIDLQRAPNVYLHNNHDIQQYLLKVENIEST